jgi:hypothetical protein
LADAYGRVGQLDEGRRMISDALDTIEKGGQRYYEAEMVSATPRCCRQAVCAKFCAARGANAAEAQHV